MSESSNTKGEQQMELEKVKSNRKVTAKQFESKPKTAEHEIEAIGNGKQLKGKWNTKSQKATQLQLYNTTKL